MIARRAIPALGVLLTLGACAPKSPDSTAAVDAQRSASTTDANADAFVARINQGFLAPSKELAAAEFTQATNITPDTQFLAARANERYLEYFTRASEESRRWAGKPASAASARGIAVLSQQVNAPAPADPAKRAELAELLAQMKALYGEAKWCPAGPDSCRNEGQVNEVIAKSRNYDELKDAWVGWHSIGAQMRPKYSRFVTLANEGARETGFADLGAMWRSRYDMPADDFEAESAKLWGEVKPLYDALHCYARTRLAERYGADKVPAGKPIPAQLLGNVWAQQWNNIYDDVLKPYPQVREETADAGLVKQKWDASRMARSAESAYKTLGFQPLPDSFWKLSMLTRPRDREVVCHASAWNMDAAGDVRIKMCTEPKSEDLLTWYHELGHVYYYLSYIDQPYLFQSGAHDGFHEAIGDTVNLSVTPAYLHEIGLVSAVKPSREALINEQMQSALEKVAFLPFGKVIDEWRWKVFSGEIPPERYNETWWDLRRQYQGIAPPVARTEADFDAGAKYHVPANTPYTRYFLSFLIQFQFHKALCDAAGFKGPLHECSVFGNEEAGKRFRAMLATGQSEPWQDTFEKLTGTRQMSGAAIVEYFAPLQAWLTERNQGQQCGWQ